MNFDEAFAKLIGFEGGYTAGIGDPGGETRYGISKRSYPAEDIRNLTLDRAKQIYFRDYWAAAGCELVPDGAKFDLFDMAVNSGVKQAIKTLQKALDEVDDGVIGPNTLQSLQTIPAPRLVARFNGYRLDLMTSLPTWAQFGKGWARRIAANLQAA